MGKYRVIDNNVIDKQGILNILKSFIFGNVDISIYDQNKTYNSGDIAFVIDILTGNVKVIIATKNNITGPYDPEKWNDMTLADTIGNGLDDTVIISENEPTERITQIWLTPNEYTTHYINTPNSSVTPDVPDDSETIGSVLLITDSAIPIVEDTDTADLGYLDVGDIVFDWENRGILSVEGLTSIYINDTIVVDEQEDVEVNDNKPIIDDSSHVWFDTDLSDDVI